MLQDVARRSWLRRRFCVKFHTKTTAAAKLVSRTRDFDADYFMTQLGREKRTRRGGDWNEPVRQDAGWLSFWQPWQPRSSSQLLHCQLRCNWTPLVIPYICDGCGTCSSMHKAGGLVHCRHKDKDDDVTRKFCFLCLWFVQSILFQLCSWWLQIE